MEQTRERWNRTLLKRILTLASKVLLYIAAFTTISGLFAYALVFHGPFTNLKEIYVASAMTTLNHQYLATWLLSDDEIEDIMENNKVPEPTEYTDESAIQIDQSTSIEKPESELIEIKGSGFKGYLLKISDPQRVSLVGANKLGKVGMRVEDFANQYHAAAAINGGGFADPEGHGNGGTPLGIVISGGRILFSDNSAKYSIIGFDSKDVLLLGEYTLEQIRSMQLRDAVSFGPFLVINGKGIITEGNGGWGLAPRTAIGQTADGTVLFLVIDGRQLTSVGASLKDVQDIMLQHGAINAANLDGGSSSALFYDGKIINKPSGKNGARHIPNAFIIRQQLPKAQVVLREAK
jgi:exopolysaccharide biosynthesis protein